MPLTNKRKRRGRGSVFALNRGSVPFGVSSSLQNKAPGSFGSGVQTNAVGGLAQALSAPSVFSAPARSEQPESAPPPAAPTGPRYPSSAPPAPPAPAPDPISPEPEPPPPPPPPPVYPTSANLGMELPSTYEAPPPIYPSPGNLGMELPPTYEAPPPPEVNTNLGMSLPATYEAPPPIYPTAPSSPLSTTFLSQALLEALYPSVTPKKSGFGYY